MKRSCTWTRAGSALCATGTFLFDRTNSTRPGRVRDLPLASVAHILANLDGDCLAFPRAYAGLPDADIPACLRWLRDHATLGRRNGSPWRPELGVGC